MTHLRERESMPEVEEAVHVGVGEIPEEFAIRAHRPCIARQSRRVSYQATAECLRP